MRIPPSFVKASLLLFFAVCAFAGPSGCSCSNTLADAGDSGTGANDASANNDASSNNDGAITTRDGSTGIDAGMSSAEICDGVDNDLNGIIDDVDVGGDGICDCLLIATLGIPGEWGDGDVFAAWLDARSDMGATSLGDATLTAALLEPYEVIVVQDIRGRTYSSDEVAALRGWIEAGGGLMTLIGYGNPDERTNVNRLLMPTGLQYDSAQILAGSPTIPVTTWHTHPVADMITQVGVDNGYEVTGDGTLIAEQGGFDMLRATTLGAGHVLVWGDEWITYDSEWVMHPEYQLERFWLNSIKWLTPAAECQVPILF